MKIIIASAQAPPTISGIARLAAALDRDLRSRGHEVVLLTEGNGCHRVGKIAVLDSSGKKMLDRGCSVLQVIGPTPAFTEQTVRYARRRGLRTVYRLDALPGIQTYWDNPITRLIDAAYARSVLLPALNRIDMAIFATLDLAKEYQTRRGKFEVIPSGIDPCSCLAVGHRGTTSRVTAKDASRLTRLLFVGQLRPYKGLPYLLKAVKVLNSAGTSRVCLDVIGDGPDRTKLERLSLALGVRDGVQFHGWVDERALHSAYCSHDVLVLPSISAESFGLVALEARVHGMSVVGSDLPGTRELILRLGGITVPPRDSDALVHVIHRLQSLPAGLSNEIGQWNEYSWPNITSRYLDAYEKLLAHN